MINVLVYDTVVNEFESQQRLNVRFQANTYSKCII